MIYCKNCITPSSRPRITFDSNGLCNACSWSEEKKRINWLARQTYFATLTHKLGPRCIVPWSGGKDSIYVAYRMRDFGLNPILLCVVPHMESEIGRWNREHMCPDFEKLFINLKEEKYRTLARKYFMAQGRPKHPWECAISAVILRQAVELKIPLIVYGEDGEQEYGGATPERGAWKEPVSPKWLMKYYYQGQLDWPLPPKEEIDKLFFTQWSHWEGWSPSEHAHFAVNKGMRTEPVRNVGTLMGTAQNSDDLQPLHTYLMFIKFGFGRCTSDASIAIRDGWMGREEAVEWAEHYDNEYPWRYHQQYLDYFQMNEDEYWATIDKFANKDFVEPDKDHRWQLKDEHIQARRH